MTVCRGMVSNLTVSLAGSRMGLQWSVGTFATSMGVLAIPEIMHTILRGHVGVHTFVAVSRVCNDGQLCRRGGTACCCNVHWWSDETPVHGSVLFDTCGGSGVHTREALPCCGGCIFHVSLRCVRGGDASERWPLWLEIACVATTVAKASDAETEQTTRMDPAATRPFSDSARAL